MKFRNWTNRPSVTRDGLDAMTRLLSQVDDKGFVYVDYDQQWKTVEKAIKLGYLDDDQRLTDKGREHLKKQGQ